MHDNYQYRQQAFHIKIYWNYLDTRGNLIPDLKNFFPADKTLVIQGIVENYSGGALVFNVELVFTALDEKDHPLASVTGQPRDYILKPQQPSPFTIRIPFTGKEFNVTLKEKYEWRDV